MDLVVAAKSAKIYLLIPFTKHKNEITSNTEIQISQYNEDDEFPEYVDCADVPQKRIASDLSDTSKINHVLDLLPEIYRKIDQKMRYIHPYLF